MKVFDSSDLAGSPSLRWVKGRQVSTPRDSGSLAQLKLTLPGTSERSLRSAGGSPENRNWSPCSAQLDPTHLQTGQQDPRLFFLEEAAGSHVQSRPGARERLGPHGWRGSLPGLGKGWSKNVSYSSFFLPGPAPPLPPNNSFPIAQHASQQQGPALQRACGPWCGHPCHPTPTHERVGLEPGPRGPGQGHRDQAGSRGVTLVPRKG